MDYRIGDVANILGVTREAVRKYEKLGIIQPLREDDSSYRKYNIKDIGVLIRTRTYRQFGFKLKEISNMVNDYDFTALSLAFSDQAKEIEEQIVHQMNLLNCLRKWENTFRTIQTLDGVYTIEERPALYGIACIQNNQFIDDEALMKKAIDWLDYVPFVYSGGYYTKDEIACGCGAIKMHFCADAEDMEFLPLSKEPPVRYWPKRMCLHTAVTLQNTAMSIQAYQPALAYMKKKGLCVQDSVMHRTIASINKNVEHKIVTDIWIPIE